MATPPVCPNPRYRLKERLGRGGQGSTWRAQDLETGADVAVKVFDLRHADDWKRYDLFERECSVLRGLDHPRIPRYLDAFRDEEAGRTFLVMELREGRSLASLVKERGSFEADDLLAFLLAALDVLDYLHGRTPPIIHRDLKPENLILEPDGSHAVVDFGGVRVALRPDGGSTVVGTFGYMAPEQLHGEATPATDIYGLGATILAMAAGADGDALPRKGLGIDVAKILPPGRLRDVLEQMTRPDPTERLRSVAEVRERLGRGASRAAEPGPEPRPEGGRRQGPPALTGPGGLLAFVIFVTTSIAAAVLYFVGHFLLPTVFSALGHEGRGRRRLPDARRQRRRERAEQRQRRTLQRLDSAQRELRRLAQRHDPERQRQRQRRMDPPRPRKSMPRRRGRG